MVRDSRTDRLQQMMSRLFVHTRYRAPLKLLEGKPENAFERSDLNVTVEFNLWYGSVW